eukprot:6186524-Pleurochrysis_carterae.AAC.3
MEEAAKAHPCPRAPSDATLCGTWRRVTRRAEDRNGNDPSPRWKCCGRNGASLGGSGVES